MRHLTILAILISFFSTQAQPYYLHYDIFYKNWDVGDLVSKISKTENELELHVKSTVIAKLIVTVEVKYFMKCRYRNNVLQYSSVVTYLNGNKRSSMIVIKKDGYYEVNEDGEIRKFCGDVKISDGILCITEPENVSRIFSEFDAIYKPIIKTAKDQYRATNPKNNNFTDYYFKNGILQKSEIHYTLATFDIRKK